MSGECINLDFREDVAMLKDGYKCSKCKSETYIRPLLLKTCRHIFCSRCVVIKGTQKCPKCEMPYKPKDVDRDNSLVKAILVKIRRIDELLAAENYQLQDVPIEEIRDYMRNFYSQNGEMHASSSQTISEVQTPERVDEEVDKVEANLKMAEPVPDALKHFRVNRKAVKRNAKGETSLHVACKRRNLEEVRKLLKTSIDVNSVDWSNWTPLHEAVQANSLECVKELLKEGCLINVPAKNYLTPLYLAAEAENEQMCALLIQHGGDPKARDQSGNACVLSLQNPDILTANANIPARTLTYHFAPAKEYCKNITDAGEKLLKTFSVWNNMEYFIVSPEYQAKEVIGVLTSILLAVPLVNPAKVQIFINCEDASFVELIPSIYRGPFFRSLHNRLHNLPKLFDGMNIHLPRSEWYSIKGVRFRREELQGLIELGGGNVLKRAPTEASVAGCTQQAFHCRDDAILANCSHFILYDSNAPPLLLYKMKELRHINAAWLTECISNFRITGEA